MAAVTCSVQLVGVPVSSTKSSSRLVHTLTGVDSWMAQWRSLCGEFHRQKNQGESVAQVRVVLEPSATRLEDAEDW
ncbi:MAG: hypothetical protein ACK56I_24110, partial [bacterium]